MGVLPVAAQHLRQLCDLLGQLRNLGGQLGESGVALGQRCFQERNLLLGILSLLAWVAWRHIEVRSRSDPAVDPLPTKRAG